MQKISVQGVEVLVGNHVYKTRYCRLVIFGFFLLVSSPATRGNEPLFAYVLVLIFFGLLVHEIRRMAFKPTLLVIGYDGVYHHQIGFVPWSNVESIDFFVGSTNTMHKALILTTIERRVKLKYHWLPRPIRVESNVLRLDMSYSDCNIQKAYTNAKVMREWYLAHHSAS